MLKSSSIYKCISPLFYFSKIFGLAPFNLPTKNGILKTSNCYYLFFLFIESSFLYLFFGTIVDNINNVPIAELNIFNLCLEAALFYNIITAFIAIFLSIFLRKKLFQTLKLINECDKKVLNT